MGQALAKSLSFIIPLLARKEKEAWGRGGWPEESKNRLASKAKGGKGVKNMVCWKLFLLSFPALGETIPFPKCEFCCEDLGGWAQGLVRYLVSRWDIPTEGYKLCRAPGSKQPLLLFPATSEASGSPSPPSTRLPQAGVGQQGLEA